MFYYVLNSSEEIAIFDTDRARLKGTLIFKPELLPTESHTDEETGETTTIVKTDDETLESLIQETDREITVIDGQCVFADEHVDEVLALAKETKLTELAEKSALFEENLNKDMYFTSSVGFRVNGDRRTRSNIEDLITYSQSFPVNYRDYDNNTQSVTKEQLQTMLGEHIANGNNLYTQKWNLESQINACTTVDEVNAITIEFEMMDFSNE